MRLLRHLDYPPVWLVLHMAVAQFMANVWAPLEVWGVWPGRVLIAAGFLLMLWAGISFRRAQTTVVPHRAPAALVETGPYRWSRNPIYLADLMILAGWALLVGSPAALLLLIPFYSVLMTRFVLREEAVLSEHLGAKYADFCDRVPRWF